MSLHRPTPDRQRGTIMVLVMTILAALLAGGAVALYLSLSASRSAGFVSRSRASLYCSEAGLVQARGAIGASFANWDLMLDGIPDNETIPYPITGDIDQPPDGVPDYEVTIRDNDDELPPLDNDGLRDNDLQVFIVSRCTKYDDTPRSVMELVTYQGGGNVYRDQAGYGPGGTGNKN